MAGSKRDEQEQEIDCLLSMFPEELSVTQKKPTYIFELMLSNISEHESDCSVSLTLKFSLGKEYPDEVPEIEVVESESLSEEELAQIIDSSNQVCLESLGMPMIFSVIMQVQDALANAIQRVVQESRDEYTKKQKQLEEAEKRRFHGTPVTVQNFLAWKKRFDAEMAAIRKAKEKAAVETKSSLKPTGKELFLRDEALVDVAGIAEDDDIVDSSDSEDETHLPHPDLGIGED